MNNHDHQHPNGEDPQERRGVCMEHSGMATKLNGGLVLLITILGMLGYQVFIQVPQLKLDLAKDIGKLEARVTALEKKDSDLDKEVERLEERLSKFEGGQQEAKGKH